MKLRNAPVGVGWLLFLRDGFHEHVLCWEQKKIIIIFFTRSDLFGEIVAQKVDLHIFFLTCFTHEKKTTN